SPIVARIDKGRGVAPAAPSCPQQAPCGARDSTVAGLPLLDPLARQQEIGIERNFAGHVDHARWSDEARRQDGVARVVWNVFSGDPMDRGVEVRARVLAHADGVPVPGWTVRVVLR